MPTARSTYDPDGTLRTETSAPPNENLAQLQALMNDRRKDYEWLRARGPVQPPQMGGGGVFPTSPQMPPGTSNARRPQPPTTSGPTSDRPGPVVRHQNPADDPEHFEQVYIDDRGMPTQAWNVHAIPTGKYVPRITTPGGAGTINPNASGGATKWAGEMESRNAGREAQDAYDNAVYQARAQQGRG